MPDSQKTDAALPGIGTKAPTRTLEVSRQSDACMVMADWVPEDWTPPETFGSFFLREVCPGVVDFFVNAGHFSARDLKNITNYLALKDVDPKDTGAVYDAILDRVEIDPWALPMLEVVVCSRRLGSKSSALSKRGDKTGKVLSKLPLSKLRLMNNHNLHSRVHEIALPNPGADLAVAAFCEYAINAYYQLVDKLEPAELSRASQSVLIPQSDKEKLEAGLYDIESVIDWFRNAAHLLQTIVEYPDVRSSLLQEQVIRTLKELTASLHPASDHEHFQLIHSLALLGRDQSTRLVGAQHELIMEEVAKAGIPFEPNGVTDIAIEILGALQKAGILSELVAANSRIDKLKAVAADLRTELRVAQEDDDFDRLGELVKSAKTNKTSIEEAEELQKYQKEVILQILDGRICDIDSLPEDMCLDRTLEHDDGSLHTVRDHFRSNVGDDDHSFSEKEAEEPDPDQAKNTPSTTYKAAPDDTKNDTTMALEEPTSTAVDEQCAITAVDVSQGILVPHAHNFETKSLSPENSATAPAGTLAPVNTDVLADLISRDILGIAAEASEAFEAEGRAWPIEAAVLRAAAGARAPHREYGLDTQRFLAIANKAISARPDDLGSVFLLGALIRPAIMEPTFSLRGALSDLCQGSLGQHLKPAAEAIADLDYDFPPSADELADLSGTQREPLRRRLAKQLADWCDTYSQKTSRWPFATSFMHHVVSEHGNIGAARVAIERGAPDAAQKARKAISDLSSPSEIEDRSTEFAALAGRTSSRLHPKGVEYLNRQFDVPLGLLDSWVRATEREGNHSQRSAAKLRTTVGNLVTRLDNAAKVLREQGQIAKGNLERAIAVWIAQQAEASIKALEGLDTSTFPTLEEALTAERDLLPAAVREAIEVPDLRFEAIRTALADSFIPTPAAALEQARKEAAFDTAARIAVRFRYEASGSIRDDMIAFAETWRSEIKSRERRLKALAKVDYDHQDEISRRLNWCKFTLERLAALREGSEIHDLADIPANTAELDDILGRIETNIRAGQVERILRYRNDQNSDDTETLLNMLDDLNNEAVEDRIAQLRDGRSAATFQTELEGLIRNFTPDFLTFAASPSWPTSIDGFREALAGDGKLAIEEDRRAAGIDFISLYGDVVTSMTLKKPAMNKVRELLEEIGFENVKFHSPRGLGTKSWQAMLTGTIRSDGWFLPPVFGSKAISGYKLLMIGPDTLPETVIKVLEPDTPAILLVAGVADLTKRLEFAERLRAGAHPVLFIDEALIAFAATRRDTRARTIFECGLPYGRVEPYTTDAGQIPPEMFFGRAEEIRSIMSKTADGCLVYGGRQLGKSALLSHVSRTRNDPDEHRIVLRREVKSLGNAEKTSEIWAHLNAMLMPYGIVKNASRDADSVSRDIKQWLATRPQGQIVCMFDETDHFMASDTKADYPELSRLKELMEDTARSFKIVFAGLHNVQRMHRQPNSPLAHLGLPICIGPLNRTEDDKRAAHELVVQPTRAAGFRFEAMEAVEEILAWANYYPSLVQEYAKGLLATLHGAGSGKAYKLPSDGPLWTIPSESLFEHRGFNAIEVRVRQKFHWTLDLDPRYALITYTLARLNAEGNEHQSLVSGFKPVDLREEAMAFWPKTAEQPSQASFEALLEELFDLGVLGRVPVPHTSRFTYLLRTRQVAAMLGSIDDIYHALGEIEEKDPTVAYDRAIYRRRYALPRSTQPQSEWPYSPLTDLQIERIVHKDSVPVQIVCGLDVLGLSKIGRALKHISETSRLPGAPQDNVPVEIVSSARDLGSFVNGARAGNQRFALVVFTPNNLKEANEAISWLEIRPNVLDGQIRPIIVLDAADEEMRAIAIRRRDQSQFLTAWGAEMVRVHLHMIEEPELDKRPLRKAILDAAGGIPAETLKLVKEMSLNNDPAAVAAQWKVAERFPEKIVKGPLGRALPLLELADGEDYETLDVLMREQLGCDLMTIGPDLMATGLVAVWNAKSGLIRPSALGIIIGQMIEG